MSKKNGKWLLLTVLGIGVLMFVGSRMAVIVMGQQTTNKSFLSSWIQPKDKTTPTAVAQESQASPTKASETKLSDQYERYVFVGDSRYVGMEKNAQKDDLFISKRNMGYPYLVEKMGEIKSSCNENTALIVGLGVNDVNYSCQKYVKKLNEMAETMDCQIYYMLVNPVDEETERANGYHIRNSRIDEFNQSMRDGLSSKIKVIDTNAYLKGIGYVTVDGLHYNEQTYQEIYKYIKQQVNKMK